MEIFCRLNFSKHARSRKYREIKIDSGAEVRVAPKDDHVICQQDYDDNALAAAYASTIYSRTALIRKLVIRIGLALRVN